jgi:hypothetical protein
MLTPYKQTIDSEIRDVQRIYELWLALMSIMYNFLSACISPHFRSVEEADPSEAYAPPPAVFKRADYLLGDMYGSLSVRLDSTSRRLWVELFSFTGTKFDYIPTKFKNLSSYEIPFLSDPQH